ncbi:MAG: hypothetical protein UX57_C0004G0040 [Candidatus Uhrbacteria bacterium GW2011_GWE2_46_68]|uniref:Uncharacterized protein n=2 Tax=Candidatus Uhriibacteriota TaxID=1752732 RepID=A0A0G1Q8F7_9BACT|nr:MAG: hypothetical protein UX45_C0001G0100 [Candidatus Uhrbacteria bacterium GW2011_GWF2_46_218]KKU41336.1 MAG: hypothetical protein UX57_C0004G0040 [Candidatus Uhrbacteria bacterium GW2011_GWE2_46_68]
MATKVSPIKKGGMCKRRAKDTDPWTKKSAPLYKRRHPKKRKMPARKDDILNKMISYKGRKNKNASQGKSNAYFL